MYSLVNFERAFHRVYPSRQIKHLNEGNVIVKDKGARFKGKVLMSHDSASILQKVSSQLHLSPLVVLHDLTNQQNMCSFYNENIEKQENHGRINSLRKNYIYKGYSDESSNLEVSEVFSPKPKLFYINIEDKKKSLNEHIQANFSKSLLDEVFRSEEYVPASSSLNCSVINLEGSFENNQCMPNTEWIERDGMASLLINGSLEEEIRPTKSYNRCNTLSPLSDKDPYYTDEDSDYVPSGSVSESPEFESRPSILTDLLTSTNTNNDILPENHAYSISSINLTEQKSPASECMDRSEVDVCNNIKDKQYCLNKVRKITSVSPSRNQVLSNNLPRRPTKKHCCLYCGKLYEKLGRHLTTVHAKEQEVAKLNLLPPKNSMRVKILSDLRKQGDYKYNTLLSNSDGQVVPISCRRAQLTKIQPPSYYIPCPECKGFYSTFSLKHHMKKCGNGINPYGRALQNVSRSLATHQVHSAASDILCKHVLPPMRFDLIGSIARQDELIISYGNRLCKRYRRSHYQNYQMIRARMRSISHFFIEFRKLNGNVSCLREALKLQYTDTIVAAIEKVAQVTVDRTKYNSACTAQALTAEIKDIILLLARQYTKECNKEMAEHTFTLKQLLESEFSENILATVKESRHDQRRKKKHKLPTTNDIAQFSKFLKKKILHHHALLYSNFTVDNWKMLAGYTLVSIQVFNRKRTGEVQNMTLEDYSNYKRIDKRTDLSLISTFSDEQRKRISKYVQVSLRSKRSLKPEGTAVLLRKLDLAAIDSIIKFRYKANVPKENPYVFGTPSKHSYMTLNAHYLISKFSKEANLKDHALMRGNHLRKHLATVVAVGRYRSEDKEKLSDFMAHSQQIHKNYYELLPQVANITEVSGMLETAAGHTSLQDNCSFSTLLDDSCNQEDDSGDLRLDEFTNLGDTTVSKSCNKVLPDLCSEVQQLSPTVPSPTEINLSPGYSDSSDDHYKVSSRRSWNTPEKEVVKSHFKDALLTGLLPSASECRQLISNSKTLSKRNPTQIRTFLKHQHERFLRPSVQKRAWATPERHIVRKAFQEHYKRNSLPSLSECHYVKRKNTGTLHHRSPEMIKAFVQHDQYKNKISPSF